MWFKKHQDPNEAIEKRVEDLEDELKSLRLDWDDVYARCRKLLGRTVKERERIEQSASNSEVSAPVEPTEQENGGPFNSTTYTAHQKNLQQLILRRRGGVT